MENQFSKGLFQKSIFKISKSGTLTMDPKELVNTNEFKELISKLKPVKELNQARDQNKSR